MKWSYLFLILSLGGSAFAGQWKRVTLTMPATLRTMETGNNVDYLVPVEKLNRLPKGTVLRYDFSKIKEKLYYKTSQGNIIQSKGKWITTIVIEKIPNMQITEWRLGYINKQKLFVSAVHFPEVKTIATDDSKTFDGDYWTCYDKLANTGIAPSGLANLIEYLSENRGQFKVTRYAIMADFSLDISNQRMYLIDFKNCTNTQSIVAHGRFSDGAVRKYFATSKKYRDGYRHEVRRCLHPGAAGKVRVGKNLSSPVHDRYGMTRPGFAKIEGFHTTNMKWPQISNNGMKALKLFGLEEENKKIRQHGVVFHESFLFKKQGHNKYRSLGCPSTYPGNLKSFHKLVKDGALFYAYVPECK